MLIEKFHAIMPRCGTLSSVLYIFILLLPYGDAISCYTCSSWNQSDRNCYDPYNPASSKYTENCMVPKPGHIGNFPANFCLKITGEKEKTREKLVIRACIMETMDNQCGVFKFQNDSFMGCILTCGYNGCNAGTTLIPVTFVMHSFIAAFCLVAFR